MTALAPNFIKPIKNEVQYRDMLAAIESLLDSEPGTPEADLLEVLSLLILDYEEREMPIEKIKPIDAIKLQMEELGISSTELSKALGGKGRVSELLNGKRPLSLRQIKILSPLLKIPANMLIEL